MELPFWELPRHFRERKAAAENNSNKLGLVWPEITRFDVICFGCLMLGVAYGLSFAASLGIALVLYFSLKKPKAEPKKGKSKNG
jgi:hypothetical protein